MLASQSFEGLKEKGETVNRTVEQRAMETSIPPWAQGPIRVASDVWNGALSSWLVLV